MNGIIDQRTAGPKWPEEANRLPLDTNPPPPELSQRSIEDLKRQIQGDRTEFETTLQSLKKFFVFTKTPDIENFLWSYRMLAPIILEAAPHFQSFFPDSPIALDVMTEEGPTRTIYAIAQWPGDRTNARKALNAFEENWWLENLPKAAGRIVFDYELSK
jgi:hypothetical protein